MQIDFTERNDSLRNIKPTLYSEYLISLLNKSLNSEVSSVSEINDIDGFPFPKDFDFKFLYSLADLHSVAPAVYPAIKNIKSTNIELFKTSHQRAWKKTALRFIEISSILSKTDEFGINCIPLKGSVIKEYYPSPEMRTMADIDFLFDINRLEDIKLIMYQLGYVPGTESENQYIFYKEPVMNVEFHPSFFIKGLFNDDYLNPGWQYACPTGKGKPLRKLTNEGFYIYMMAHIAQHFKFGGAGVRSVMDVWVFLKRFKKDLDWLFINHELRHAGILEFSNNIKALAGAWFGSRPMTPLTGELGKYILQSGTFGKQRNYYKKQLAKGKCVYIIKNLFPAYSVMKNKYPLVKTPLLLPIGWIVRAFNVIIFKHKTVKGWLFNIMSVNKSSAADYNEMLKRFGL